MYINIIIFSTYTKLWCDLLLANWTVHNFIVCIYYKPDTGIVTCRSSKYTSLYNTDFYNSYTINYWSCSSVLIIEYHSNWILLQSLYYIILCCIDCTHTSSIQSSRIILIDGRIHGCRRWRSVSGAGLQVSLCLICCQRLAELVQDKHGRGDKGVDCCCSWAAGCCWANIETASTWPIEEPVPKAKGFLLALPDGCWWPVRAGITFSWPDEGGVCIGWLEAWLLGARVGGKFSLQFRVKVNGSSRSSPIDRCCIFVCFRMLVCRKAKMC